MRTQKSQAAETPAAHAIEGWEPAEFKGRRGRWRDPGVYIDGELRGMLRFAELPARLRPIWVEGVRSLDFKPGDKGPRQRQTHERRFSVAGYLEALGAPLSRIRAVHIYGGRGFAAVVSPDVLRAHRDELLFAFGRETSGKPLLYVPRGVALNTQFDQIRSIAVYIDKAPPALDEDEHLELDGKRVRGIPYRGEPARGGVRIYLDDRIATVFKRNQIEDLSAIAEPAPNGYTRYRVRDLLRTRGVDLPRLVAGEIVHDDQRGVRLEGAALDDLTFLAGPRARGHVLVGKSHLPAAAIMLYSRPVSNRFAPAAPRIARR